jgi:glyoxylase-like metal-dependent hydrolase (beta-lactamase superfamily II)
MKSCCSTFFLLVITPIVLTAQDFDAVQIETIQVKDNIYMLKGSGGNIGVITGEDGVLIVDDQYAPLAPKIKAAIAEISDKPVKYVINTHWHGDHMGGNEVFGADGSIIIAHDNVRTRLSTDQFMKHQQREVPASPEIAWPIVTFSDEITYYFNDEEILVRHAPPAHTDGDAAIYFKNANVIHMGDAFVRYGYPFVDISSGGSVMGMVANLDEIIEMINDETVVIPGHGEISNRQDMIAFRDTLRDIVAGVQQGIDKGQSLEEIQASEIASRYDEQWGGGFIKGKDFVSFTYLSLEPAKP